MPQNERKVICQQAIILIADDDAALARPAARQSPISWNATIVDSMSKTFGT
ncbi:hypothetical protein ACFLWY_01775 [Chloroflexota bacterium]